MNEFMKIIDVACLKVLKSRQEYDDVAQSALMVKATTLFSLYKVYGTGELTMQEFFKTCGSKFYFDKYVCTHGTEFYYYIIFDESAPMFAKDRIYSLVANNAPDTLTDVINIIRY